MTVRELIAELATYPEDMVVLHCDTEWGEDDIKLVKCSVVESIKDTDYTHTELWDVRDAGLKVGDTFISIRGV